MASRAGGESPVPADGEILTTEEACRFLKIGRTKLWQLTQANEVPAYRVGNSARSELRYLRSELLAWLSGNRLTGKRAPKEAQPDHG